MAPPPASTPAPLSQQGQKRTLMTNQPATQPPQSKKDKKRKVVFNPVQPLLEVPKGLVVVDVTLGTISPHKVPKIKMSSFVRPPPSAPNPNSNDWVTVACCNACPD